MSKESNGHIDLGYATLKEKQCAKKTGYVINSNNSDNVVTAFNDCLRDKPEPDEETITPEVIKEPETYTDIAINAAKDIYTKITLKPLLNNVIVGSASLVVAGILNEAVLKTNTLSIIAISLVLFGVATHFNLDEKIM